MEPSLLFYANNHSVVVELTGCTLDRPFVALAKTGEQRHRRSTGKVRDLDPMLRGKAGKQKRGRLQQQRLELHLFSLP